jgi:hypothetical protein
MKRRNLFSLLLAALLGKASPRDDDEDLLAEEYKILGSIPISASEMCDWELWSPGRNQIHPLAPICKEEPQNRAAIVLKRGDRVLKFEFEATEDFNWPDPFKGDRTLTRVWGQWENDGD